MENIVISAQSPDDKLACNADVIISQLLAAAIERA